jgi:hypothetical protein
MTQKLKDSREKKAKKSSPPKPIKVSDALVAELRGGLRGTSCCGLGEYSGCSQIESVADVIAIRLAGRRVNKGLVFLTTIPEQESSRRVMALENGGFRKMGSNSNPNTGRRVTIWVAQTLSRRPNGYVS